MIWVRVYGGRGRSLFCHEYSRFPGNLSKQSSTAPDFETCSAHTHTQTKSYMPDEKNTFKHVHILENVVNICIINDLSYPPATHPQTRIFLLPDPQIIHSARGYTRRPRITTAHSAQISTASLGCKVREFVCVDCVRRMLFIQDLQPDNLGIYLLDYSYNEVWAILSARYTGARGAIAPSEF